jgi:hypothetical protein
MRAGDDSKLVLTGSWCLEVVGEANRGLTILTKGWWCSAMASDES